MKTILLSFLLLCLATTANAQSDCTAPTFWIVNSFGEIREYELSADTVINNGTIISNAPGQSLAFCNNMNGGSYQPTFYSSFNNQAWYYDGANWVEFDAPTQNYYLPNAGGYGNNLYFLNNINVGAPLYYYSANKFDTIYSNPTLAWTVADVAVDDSGYAWVFLGTDNPITTDSIYVLSPTGQIIHKYAFNMITSAAYGATFIQGDLYIGLNYSDYTSKLFKLTLNGSTISAGPAINMPYAAADDLASCNHVTPLTGIQNLSASLPVRLSPDPASNQLNIILPAPCTVSIFNITGQLIYTSAQTGVNLDIDVSSFPTGLYFLQTTSTTSKGYAGEIQQSIKFSVAH